MTTNRDGGQLFVRYAFPPNERGSCGPDDHRQLFEYGVRGVSDPGLRTIAEQFSGAWPYLDLLARSSGIGDPLDARVVEAYWLGNDLLTRVSVSEFGRSLDDRFRRRIGASWETLSTAMQAGGVPNHAFHVFAVYPWVGLLAADRGPDPLHILDQCRIRWGRVVAAVGDEVIVESRPLEWNGAALTLGEIRTETAVRAVDGRGFLVDLEPGDWVSLHWRWVCDRLNARQLDSLSLQTRNQLAITNASLATRSAILA